VDPSPCTAAVLEGERLLTHDRSLGLLGLGTALTYTVLLAVVGDLAAPSWRAAAVGVYRTWRDGGYVIGAVAAGVLADLFGVGTALVIVALATALSGWDAWVNLRSSSNDLNSLV